MGEGLIHGDAHTENLLYDSTADRWMLIDFDHAAHGPRELDLLFAAPDHFHEPAADREAFTRAYGYNLLTWPGWQNAARHQRSTLPDLLHPPRPHHSRRRHRTHPTTALPPHGRPRHHWTAIS